MNAVILPFSIDYYEAVLDLWRRSDGIGLSDADSREEIAAYLARNPGMSFVAVADGIVLGAILSGHDGRRGYVHHAAVEEASRCAGIGSALVEHALQALRAVGIQKTHIFVYSDNEAAFRFWESSGWLRRSDIQVMTKTL